MASFPLPMGRMLMVFALLLIVLPGRAHAFGAGNIPGIAQVEGHNWRHGDIEDMLKTIAFLNGKKWTTMMVSRTYFGNWLRDYSQAVDVGSLKGVNAATIRILVWVLSFLSNGYATEEFEVTEERLGVYRPEEHIDNPLGYGDGKDAREFDPRLRGPVDPREVEVDPRTGMKNYIANESGNWATSSGYLRFSFSRSIHFGRVYCHGTNGKGREEDLCEALRCLGQALHCMEDFSAHSNYCELALRELGYHDVFPHCGTATQINLHGKTVYPIVTGTFGGVDFLHSVLGEANDHFTQSEVDELDVALKNAEQNRGGGLNAPGQRGLFGSSSGGGDFVSLVAQLPGIGDGFASEARELKAMAAQQAQENTRNGFGDGTRANTNVVPGMSPSFDPVKVAGQIYPILKFRDKIVKSINNMISKIPGLEKLLEHISETLTAFVLGLLAPFVRPIINQVTKVLKEGSSGVISASSNSQLEPWRDPRCDNPTHSMLSKDHFTNILNSCAGRIAATILQYVVPRILYAWENPGVPVDEVVNDVLRAFHHPAIRDHNVEIQREMFDTVQRWTQESSHRHELNRLLSSESVKAGKNHIIGTNNKSRDQGHNHGGLGHGKVAGSLWEQVNSRDLSSMGGGDGNPSAGYMSSSPAPPQASRPPPQGYGYGQSQQPAAQGEAASYLDAHPQGGYGGSASYGNPPPQGYNQGYQQQPPPPQGGYWGQGPPPQQYGGPGYGGQAPYPPQQSYGQQPPQWGGQYPPY
ncbi:heterokaryon incompatibility protein Het-C [Thozetella sp. PMI_491]|nr:heterokaryon incompatibility protein Het-C [Thozetella sp. PMI_491]